MIQLLIKIIQWLVDFFSFLEDLKNGVFISNKNIELLNFKSGDQNPLRINGVKLLSLTSSMFFLMLNKMKSKLTNLFATLFLCLWAVCANAQTTTSNGKAQLIEFTNATAKFTVPAGKTWVVNNVFSSSEIEKYEYNYIILKKINNTDYGSNGPVLSNYERTSFSYPIIFPEKTTFEIQIKDLNAKAIIIFTEVDN